jgi:hypothetical protein
MDSRDVIQLLVEIRDIQKKQLEEYRRVTQEQLELSRRAVKRQERAGRLQERFLIVAALLVFGIAGYLLWTIGVVQGLRK